MTWKSIRLELARTEQHPNGSPRHVYIIHVPLRSDGLIDDAQLELEPARASVHKFWGSERPMSGYVVKTARGWAFSYEQGDGDDELISHLESHPLALGNYVTMVDPDEREVPLRVASAEDLEVSCAPVTDPRPHP